VSCTRGATHRVVPFGGALNASNRVPDPLGGGDLLCVVLELDEDVEHPRPALAGARTGRLVAQQQIVQQPVGFDAQTARQRDILAEPVERFQ
jgi:hypothetical protein